MRSNAMTASPRQLRGVYPEQAFGSDVSGATSQKWSASARLRLVILPAAGFWGLVIWVAASLI